MLFVVDYHLTPVFLAYQLEWLKCYARSQCWEEEVKLLKEEMQRTLKFLKWKSLLWLSKRLSKPLPSSPSALHEGLNAYASRQAAIFMSLHDHFFSLWQGLEVLDGSQDQLVPIHTQFEEVVQGVDGGDVDLG